MSTKEDSFLKELISVSKEHFDTLHGPVIDELSALLKSELIEGEMSDTTIKQLTRSLIEKQTSNDLMK